MLTQWEYLKPSYKYTEPKGRLQSHPVRVLVQILKPKPPPPFPAEYYLSINFWPIFSNIKEISVDEYYFSKSQTPEYLDKPPKAVKRHAHKAEKKRRNEASQIIWTGKEPKEKRKQSGVKKVKSFSKYFKKQKKILFFFWGIVFKKLWDKKINQFCAVLMIFWFLFWEK